MTYALLPLPHANRRYQEATRTLALSELALMAPHAGVDASSLRYGEVGGLPVLLFCAPELKADDRLLLRAHSAAQALFLVEGETLRPLMDERPAYLPEGMGGILKYKGKTNEQFCTLLLNAAVFSGAFAARWREPLQVLDPLCGRGTLLYQALERGYCPTGVEMEGKELHEARSFVKNFFEYHRFKHESAEGSLSGGTRRGSPTTAYTLAPDKEAWKAGDTRSLRFVHADTKLTPLLFRPESFHALAADLPYGVQHAGAGDPSAAHLLRDALPGWATALKKGGAMALSFNSYTLPFEQAVQIATHAGLTPSGHAEEAFSHWVEQAIRRNVLICIKG